MRFFLFDFPPAQKTEQKMAPGRAPSLRKPCRRASAVAVPQYAGQPQAQINAVCTHDFDQTFMRTVDAAKLDI